MFGFSLETILLIVIAVLLGGKKTLDVLALIPGFAPLAKMLEKLTKNGNGKDELKVMMGELQQHFNHDITESLKEIKEAIDKHNEDETPVLKEMNERLAILVDRSK